VVGVPEPVRGERIIAYVVLVPGLAPDQGGTGRSELFAYCAERLAAYKVPSEITARDELPHNMIGKVLRRILRDEALADHSGHSTR
jgi:acyl-coenzyme A synthetase/AMP-(fatty) acid ligase